MAKHDTGKQTQDNPLRSPADTLKPGETLLVTSTHRPFTGRLTRHASSFDVTIHEGTPDTPDTLEDAEVLDSGHFLTLQATLDFLDDAFETAQGEGLSGKPATQGVPKAGKQADTKAGKPDVSKDKSTQTHK